MIDRSHLPSGARVLSERIPGTRSTALGLWVGAGSRDEPPELVGATHFLEHLLFKATPSRSAQDIAEAFDAVGGDLNAFTTQEYTCYHARVLDDDLPMALEITSDMLQRSLLRPEDVESERQVVLQEIAMQEDSPEDHAFDLFFEALWGDHPLARRVQGASGTVEAMSRDQIAGYYQDRYGPEGLVVAAAGSVDHRPLVELVEKAIDGSGETPPPRAGGDVPGPRDAAVAHPRDIEQVHVVAGTQGLARTDPRRFALHVLHVVLGAGMSSRLFQEIRERRGLAYSVYTQPFAFAETGVFCVYAGTAPEQVREVLAIVRDQVARIAAECVTEAELARGKGHLRGNLMLSLEDPPGRMYHLGKSELCHGEILTPGEVVERIDAVGLEDVHGVARDVLQGSPWAVSALGPQVSEADLQAAAGRIL